MLVGRSPDGGVAVNSGTPREVIGETPEALLSAFEKACAVLWGANEWRAALESVCGLRAGTVRQWQRRGQIPPPMVLGWIAYLREQDEPRALGYALRAVSLSPSSLSSELCQEALRGLQAIPDPE